MRLIQPHNFPAAGDGPNTVFPAEGAFATFDGVDDYVSIPYADPLDSAHSLAFFFRPLGTLANNEGLFGFDFATSGKEIWLYLMADGSMRVRFYNAAFIIRGYLLPASTASVNTWYHFALTRDGDTMTIYLDHQDITPIQSIGSGSPPSSGQRRIGSGNQAYEGHFDMRDFRIYDKILNAAEVEYLSTEGLTGTDPMNANLQCHLKFDEGAGSTVGDSSQNGDDATAHNYTAATFWNS